MGKSSAYLEFKNHLKATGRQRMEGYQPDLLDRIYDNERQEVEKDIWHHFVKKNDTDLAMFMPGLKGYDGIGALKKKLSEIRVPSRGNADIVFALFKATGEKQYLDIIMDDYRGVPNNTPIAVGLAHLAKDPLVYPLLVDIYKNDKNETNRVQAKLGILWSRGKLENIDDIHEFSQKMDLIRNFSLDAAEE